MRPTALALIAVIIASAGRAQAKLIQDVDFSNTAQLAEDMSQDFYRAWKTRITELPVNFIQRGSQESVKFFTRDGVGCTNMIGMTGEQTVAEIRVSKPHMTATDLTEAVTFIGCGGTTIMTETIHTVGANLTPASPLSFIKGDRRFVATPNETERTFSISAPAGPMIAIRSVRFASGEERYEFFLGEAKAITLRSFKKAGMLLSEYIRLPFQGEAPNLQFDYDSGVRLRTVVQNGDTRFHVDGDIGWTNRQNFQQIYSKSIFGVVSNIGGFIMKVALDKLPATEVAKPPAGVNDRILSELNLMLTRVTTKTELELVRVQIQNYISTIQGGTLLITDNRPK